MSVKNAFLLSTKDNQRKLRIMNCKKERRETCDQQRKSKRQIFICHLRWIQDCWRDEENFQLNDIQSIKGILHEVIPITSCLHKLNVKYPRNILQMINRIASQGSQEELAQLFNTTIVHRILLEFLSDCCESADLMIDIFCNLAFNAAHYWCNSIPNMGIPDLVRWLLNSNNHDNKQHIVRIIGLLIKDQDESIKTWVFEHIHPAIIPYIQDVYYEEMATECLHFINVLITDLGFGSRERIEMMIKHDYLSSYLALVNTPSEDIVELSIKMIANIAAFLTYNEFLVDQGVLHTISPLILSSSQNIQIDTLSVVSNVAAGDQNFIQHIIDADLLPVITSELRSHRFNIQKMVASTIANFTRKASKMQLTYLIETTDAILALCSLLSSRDVNLIYTILDAIKNIVDGLRPHQSEVKKMVEEHEGLQLIDSLQNHDNEDISKISIDIIANWERDSTENDMEPSIGENEMWFNGINVDVQALIHF